MAMARRCIKDDKISQGQLDYIIAMCLDHRVRYGKEMCIRGRKREHWILLSAQISSQDFFQGSFRYQHSGSFCQLIADRAILVSCVRGSRICALPVSSHQVMEHYFSWLGTAIFYTVSDYFSPVCHQTSLGVISAQGPRNVHIYLAFV